MHKYATSRKIFYCHYALESTPLNDHLWIARPVDRMIIPR